MSHAITETPRTLQPAVTQRHLEAEVAHCVGGVSSPLLANAYLHRLDRAWRGAHGTLVRYADDALVMYRSNGQAVAALARLTTLLADLGLEPEGGHDPDRAPD